MCTMQVNELGSGGNHQSLELRALIDSLPAFIHTDRLDGYIDFFNISYAGRARAVIAKCSPPQLSAEFDRNRR